MAEGLRERKRLRTRRQIQETAIRLIDEQGYDATTVEQIADASEVSPSTFFRYFPTKEDVVVTDEYDPVLLAALEAQDPSLTPVQAFRAVIGGGLFEEILRRDRRTFLRRINLVYGTPQLRARVLDGTREGAQMFAAVLARRQGLAEDDAGLRIAMRAILAVLTTVIEDWADEGGAGDLPKACDEALALLESGFAARPATRRPAPPGDTRAPG